VVYVRQSTQQQVQTNRESQRRQYELVDVARQRGFHDIEVIDDDLGRSASGTAARAGFERLVAWLCAGEVGAVLCFDASQLARNGRDGHHLFELCGLVEARVIDLDGVYVVQLADRMRLLAALSFPTRSTWKRSIRWFSGYIDWAECSGYCLSVSPLPDGVAFLGIASSRVCGLLF
jgi:DNA invertase Pin-like site-specific DNA recombinase